MEKVTLGSRYKDKIHGIKGVATARTEYLTGCTRVALEYVEGGKIEVVWFDEPQLELVEERKEASPQPKAEETAKKDRGGPGVVAPSRDPIR